MEASGQNLEAVTRNQQGHKAMWLMLKRVFENLVTGSRRIWIMADECGIRRRDQLFSCSAARMSSLSSQRAGNRRRRQASSQVGRVT